ncbi:MAG: GntR family transcriptional regulator [candidate division WS1 bacterium]|jgi:DNA-binding GntR family transcriptional regulator|nr:GntR family transcriptional regulator [candidate division WS1 bacterium]
MRRYTLVDQAYDVLLQRIASAQLRPGDSLVEPRLAEELEISRTPVRAAIDKLVTQGLAKRRVHYGCTVAKPEPEELRDLFRVRQAVEGMAATLLAFEGADEDIALTREILEELTSAQERGDDSAYAAKDFAFHQHIIRNCGNRYIALSGNAEAMLLLSFFEFHPYKTSGLTPFWSTGNYTPHEEILHAIERRDGDTAGQAMRSHIRGAWGRVERWLTNRGVQWQHPDTIYPTQRRHLDADWRQAPPG